MRKTITNIYFEKSFTDKLRKYTKVFIADQSFSYFLTKDIQFVEEEG